MIKQRYVYIFVILAVLCLSAGAAFAAEDADQNLTYSDSLDVDSLQAISDSDSVAAGSQQSIDDGILADYEDDEEEEEDGEGPGWGDLNLVLDNDESEITLENDYGFNYWDLEDDEIEEARSGILIDRDLTIDGDGHKLDGRGFARAFNIASESHVTLKNIIFESCYADEGGAIYNSGTLTIENCQFLNCGNNWEEDCKTSNGGAIYNGGDLNVTDSIFYQNEAEKGGGIYNYGNLNVSRSAFLENNLVSNGDGEEDTSNGRDVCIASGTANISNSYMSAYGGDDKYVVYVEDGEAVLDDNYWPGGAFKWEHNEEAEKDIEVLAVSNIELNNYLDLILKVDPEDNPLEIEEKYEFYAYFVRNGTENRIEELPKSNFIFYVENMDGHTEEFEDCEVPVENGQTSYTIEDGQYAMHCEISVGEDLRLLGDVERTFGQTCKNWANLSEEISDNSLVELDGTYRFGWGEEEPYIIELNTDNQVIDGQFNTLNGVSEVSAFNITASNVIIKNLNFNKCRCAIILDGGSVTLINCTFENCEGRWDDEEECDLMGSALRINSGKADLINSTIKNCWYGAVYNGGTLNVSNSIFLNPGENLDGINVYISEGAQKTIINNSCLFVRDNWNERMNVYFENPEDAKYDLNNNFWGFENPGEENACVNADVESYIYAKIETAIPEFMNHETTFTLKIVNYDGAVLSDFFNGEVQFIESYNYMNYEEWYEALGEPVPLTDGTAAYTYTPSNDEIQFIGAQIIYDGVVVGLSSKLEIPANDFTALIELINSLPDNGVLNLSEDYYYGGSNSRDMEIREICINKNITINGNGHLIKDAGDDFNYDDNTKGFVIAEDCTVIINNLNVEIYSPIADCGAAIYNQGNLTLNNCSVYGLMVIMDSEIETACGGAIYNDEGAVMTINFSNITGGLRNNIGNYPEGLISYGGAIYNKGRLTITESDIRGHEYNGGAPSFGGGIYNEGDLNVTYSIFCHNSAEIGNDIYHNGTSLYVANSFLVSGETDSSMRNLFDFIASYGEYVLYVEKNENCDLKDIWWGTNSPDENTTNIELNNHVIFSLTAQNEIRENESNVFNVTFINNETGESLFACPHNTIIYFFIEKFSGQSQYVGNASLEDGECHIEYPPVSGDYFISAGLANDYSHYGKFDISDVRVELPIGLGGSTFTGLYDEIASADGIVNLTKDYRYDGDGDSPYSDGVRIENKNIVIEGNGHTINGAGKARGALYVADSNVTIRNVHFVNCKGPIRALGTTNLTLINCTLDVSVTEEGDDGDCLVIDNGASANIYGSDVYYIVNHGSLTIESSLIGTIEATDGSSVTAHHSIFSTYGDEQTLKFDGNVECDLNGNLGLDNDGDAASLGIHIDYYLEMQAFTSYAPNVDVSNIFTVQFVYNGTDEVDTNINFPVSFIKEFADEIDGHDHTELINHSSIINGVARLEYTPNINTRSILVLWGEIEDTNRYYMGNDGFKQFNIIPNETRINVDQDDDSIYINVTSNDVLVDSGYLEVTIYLLPEDEDNGQSGEDLLGMSFSYELAEDDNSDSAFYYFKDISELENYILKLSKQNIAEQLGIDSFGGRKWVIIVTFHSNTKNYADSEYFSDFENETKFYSIIALVDNHIGNKVTIGVKVISNGEAMTSGKVRLTSNDEVIEEIALTSSKGVIFTLDDMAPGPYDRENGNYAIVYVDESGEETSHTINFVVTAPTTITTIISNDIGSVEITINMGNATQGIIDLFKNGEALKHLELNGRNSVLVALDMIAGALEDDSYIIKFIPLNYKQATAKNTTFDLSNSQEGFGGIIIISDLPSDASGNFVIGLDDGRNISANPSEGLNIPDLPPGDHKLKLSYDGDDYYAFNLDLDYTVKESAASDISLSTVVGSHILKVSGVPSDLSEKILVTIDGTTYEGTASGIEIPSFSSPGIVAAIISYPGDAKYSSFTKNVNIAVSKIATKINPKSVTFYASPNSGYLTFYILDSSGKGLAKTVNVIFNGKTYAVNTNANGYGSIKLSAAAAKTYTASLKFAGDSIYAGSSASVQVKVNKNKVKITAKTKKVKKSAKKLKIKYLFKTSTGKKLALKGLTVYLKINKKTVKAKTSSKGIATFKVKLPKKKKTYKVKVIFKGNKANIKKTLSTKLKVY